MWARAWLAAWVELLNSHSFTTSELSNGGLEVWLPTPVLYRRGTLGASELQQCAVEHSRAQVKHRVGKVYRPRAVFAFLCFVFQQTRKFKTSQQHPSRVVRPEHPVPMVYLSRFHARRTGAVGQFSKSEATQGAKGGKHCTVHNEGLHSLPSVLSLHRNPETIMKMCYWPSMIRDRSGN